MPRIEWTDLPDAVRARVERALRSTVVSHESQPGGWSPGTADRVVLETGRRAFVKAVHPYLNPDSPDIHRAELRVMRALPAGLPVPALLGGFERDGWVVLVMEYVEADHPTLPWTRESFTPVVDAVLGLSDRLTPSPLELQPASGHCAGMWAGYARCLVQPPDDLDPWVRERLPALAERADVSLAVLDGDTLTHFDLRADNPDFFSWTAELRIERDGAMHGLIGWFECELADGVWMTNSPLADRRIERSQAFLPIAEAVPGMTLDL